MSNITFAYGVQAVEGIDVRHRAKCMRGLQVETHGAEDEQRGKEVHRLGG